MKIIFQGKELTDRQADAVSRVFVERMIGRITSKKFDMECLRAMDNAGCPFIPDDEDDTDAAS